MSAKDQENNKKALDLHYNNENKLTEQDMRRLKFQKNRMCSLHQVLFNMKD